MDYYRIVVSAQHAVVVFSFNVGNDVGTDRQTDVGNDVGTYPIKLTDRQASTSQPQLQE